jgi:hypothetical protein
MNFNEFRVIPGYDSYSVDKFGNVKSQKSGLPIKRYFLDGYLIIDAFYDSLTETLPVHRAVALAWVVNPKPNFFNVVNHLDGVRTNNYHENLEWTSYSGNNYHAIKMGFREDNIPCKLRDFNTGEIIFFDSIKQAATYAGKDNSAHAHKLRPLKFGSLFNDRYEFRYADDPEPWFYMTRSEKITPTRYLFMIQELGETIQEFYSLGALKKECGLLLRSIRSIDELVKCWEKNYPNKQLVIRDSYTEDRFRVNRKTRLSQPVPIRAVRSNEVLDFPSLSSCASYFDVDRSTISLRLDSERLFGGWAFTSMPH